MVKRCNKCNIEKDTNLFAKRGNGYQSWCKECFSVHNKNFRNNNPEYNKRKSDLRKIRAKKIQQYVVDYLKLHPCIDCGESDIVVLDFDHTDNKEFNISDGVRGVYSLKRIQLEIDKCEIRCANCHRRKTAKNYNWYKAK